MKEYCLYCFDVLALHLEHELAKNLKDKSLEIPSDRFPLFVSWYTYRSSSKVYHEKRLRGCIGNFGGLPLRDGLKEYSLISALKDTRFNPINLNELSNLCVGISLLTDFEKVGSHLDWEIGVHGIWIEFPLNGRKTTATYLPEVTAEQGWSKIEAIDSLLKKGGWKGEITDGVRGQIILTRYQSKKEVVTFEEWFTHRSNSVN